MTSTQAIFEKVQKVKKTINTATTTEKNHALEEMAKQLWFSRADILTANELDMTAAKGKISDVMLDRLYLDEERIAAMAEGILVTPLICKIILGQKNLSRNDLFQKKIGCIFFQ